MGAPLFQSPPRPLIPLPFLFPQSGADYALILWNADPNPPLSRYPPLNSAVPALTSPEFVDFVREPSSSQRFVALSGANVALPTVVFTLGVKSPRSGVKSP